MMDRKSDMFDEKHATSQKELLLDSENQFQRQTLEEAFPVEGGYRNKCFAGLFSLAIAISLFFCTKTVNRYISVRDNVDDERIRGLLEAIPYAVVAFTIAAATSVVISLLHFLLLLHRSHASVLVSIMLNAVSLVAGGVYLILKPGWLLRFFGIMWLVNSVVAILPAFQLCAICLLLDTARGGAEARHKFIFTIGCAGGLLTALLSLLANMIDFVAKSCYDEEWYIELLYTDTLLVFYWAASWIRTAVGGLVSAVYSCQYLYLENRKATPGGVIRTSLARMTGISFGSISYAALCGPLGHSLRRPTYREESNWTRFTQDGKPTGLFERAIIYLARRIVPWSYFPLPNIVLHGQEYGPALGEAWEAVEGKGTWGTVAASDLRMLECQLAISANFVGMYLTHNYLQNTLVHDVENGCKLAESVMWSLVPIGYVISRSLFAPLFAAVDTMEFMTAKEPRNLAGHCPAACDVVADKSPSVIDSLNVA